MDSKQSKCVDRSLDRTLDGTVDRIRDIVHQNVDRAVDPVVDPTAEHTLRNNKQNQNYSSIVFKNLLIRVNQEFGDTVREKRLVKRVVKLRKVSADIDQRIAALLQKNAKIIIDNNFKERQQNESILREDSIINEQISQIANNISKKQSETKRLTDAINEDKRQMEKINREDERMKNVYHLIDSERQTFTNIKTQFQQNVISFKQILDSNH